MDLLADNREQFFRIESLTVFLAVQGIACVLVQLAAGYGRRQGHAHANHSTHRQVDRDGVHQAVGIRLYVDISVPGDRRGIVADPRRHGIERHVHLGRDTDSGGTASGNCDDDVHLFVFVFRFDLQVFIRLDDGLVSDHGAGDCLADGQLQRTADACRSADCHAHRV